MSEVKDGGKVEGGGSWPAGQAAGAVVPPVTAAMLENAAARAAASASRRDLMEYLRLRRKT